MTTDDSPIPPADVKPHIYKLRAAVLAAKDPPAPRPDSDLRMAELLHELSKDEEQLKPFNPIPKKYRPKALTRNQRNHEAKQHIILIRRRNGTL